MEIAYSDKAQLDISFWKKSGNTSIMNKITKLIKAIQENSFDGIGKPEPLKFNLTGFWSRRINKQHRIVYEISDNLIFIHSLKGHYNLLYTDVF